MEKRPEQERIRIEKSSILRKKGFVLLDKDSTEQQTPKL